MGLEMISHRNLVSLDRARKIRDLRGKNIPHPRDILWAEMSARGWTVRHLAGQLEGDGLRNRALLSHYLQHPTGYIGLGNFAHRLGEAFGLNGDVFIDLEKAWLAHQRERAALKSGDLNI
jgi:plasmid maintenance system antidote protein VapI